ncbi:hypothetical protein RHSIM_Rhsim12G0099500 [Rhododendron simsii]|uniref:Uncharacterized protein n=1 Tax=Rhododendron simsii TaxID=118357 RepID=A0A834L932_RHOSS|nr:hypothetical protein RHSIM_Rhsim12G0099500 [Rhododendron simsii]
MSRRNIPRPTIPTRTSNPARIRTPSDNQPREKRQKQAKDRAPTDSSRPVGIEQPQGGLPTEQPNVPDPQPGALQPHIDLTDPNVEAAIHRQFSPSYTTPDGRVLLLNDSVKEEPNLAVTLLRGLALPRDYDQVPTDFFPGLGKMCSHLVQVPALKAYDKANKVSSERERYRTDRDSYRTKWRISENQLKESEAKVERLERELADAKKAAATAVENLKKAKEEERKKLRVADAKGYEAGIKRAALEYAQITHKMVNDELEVRLPDFYKLGYAAGADAMAGVMAIQPESGFLKQLPEPMVPDLDLPYTEEECQPLPPEEDDEEIIGASLAEAQVEVEGTTEKDAVDEQTKV